MIEKNEILRLSKDLSLKPDTVEKDYVLNWLLWGISQSATFSSSWNFKGGTSLKKCFFETFRFSEDLDFTLNEKYHLNADFLKKEFSNISQAIHEETGIEFFEDKFKFKTLPKEDGKASAQGVIHYNGPLRRKHGVASIKLDLTTDEVLVLSPVQKSVHHPYSDEPKIGIWANCYAFEEVVAEKVRALAQRIRPRDVYDVVHFFRNRNMIQNPQLVHNVLIKKCSYKGIDVPTFDALENHEKLEELRGQWENMLAHQLPSLPPLSSFWEDLEPFFNWLTGSLNEERLVPPTNIDGKTFNPGRISGISSMNSFLHKIQFAAANRVCVELIYHEKKRTIEPLSFRTSRSGSQLFYGYEREAEQPKSFSLSKIQSVEISNLPYIEKYPVEITPSGSISMPPIRRE